jgi:hypothetical protein
MAKADSKSTTVLPIPLPQMVVEDLAGFRKEASRRISRLIDFLDMTDPYVTTECEDEPDHDELEAGEEGEDGKDCDLEPSLGASADTRQPQAWLWQNNAGDDREEENEHHDGTEYGGGVDDEPSLGSLDGRMSQLRWSAPDRPVLWPNGDFEFDEAEQEGGIEDLPHDEERAS